MTVFSYSYCKKGAVNATTAGAQSNYQLELIVGESSGSSGANVHCSGHCQDFPNDIRFTKEDGATKHDYWIDVDSLEGTTPNRKVKVWIEVASIPASGSVDFYMYYCKAPDSGESDGESAFLLFDDFLSLFFKTDLDTFTKIGLYESSNPVIACGGSSDSDKYIREIGNVLYEPGEASRKYKTFYTGYNSGSAVDEKIHYAYSEDGKSWTKSTSNPVINNRRAEDPYVVKNGDTYYLFAEDKTAGGENKIRRWNSSDCETWTDDGQCTGIGDGQSPIVWIEGSTWYMLYERYPANADIALATSSNGLAWTDEPTNPVMVATDTNWVDSSLVPDSIIKKGSTYHMFYHGWDGGLWKTGIATSTNLTSWTDSSNSPYTTDESNITKIYTAMMFYDTEDVILYYGANGAGGDTSGIYRGYPIKSNWIEETNGDTASISTANSKVRLQATTTSHYANLYTAQLSQAPCALRVEGYDVDGIGNTQIKLNKDGAWPIQTDAALFALYDQSLGGGGNSDIAGIIKYGAGPSTEEKWRDLNVGNTYNKDDIEIIIRNDRKVEWKIEGTSKGVSVAAVDDESWRVQLAAIGERGATDFYVDRLFLRNYASPEPTWGSWGGERAILTKTFTADVLLQATSMKTFTADVISVNRHVKTFTADVLLQATSMKTFTADVLLQETNTKTFTADVLLQATSMKTFTADVILTYRKTFTSNVILQATNTKTFTTDVISVNRHVKTFTADVISVNRHVKTFSADVLLLQTADERGFYYAKLGSTILTSLKKDSFRITEELNKIPSFEFEISNCSANRTAIAAGITDTLTIYRRLDSMDTLMFTGRIDVDAIEYLSIERIRIPGYASYIDLNFRFHQHLNSEDAEDVGKVFDYSGSYTDYTTAANNDTINDVLLTLDSVGDIVYIGQSEQFFGAQVKYSTKGELGAHVIRRRPGAAMHQIRSFPLYVDELLTTVVWEYSKGSSIWSTLDVLDETRAFTEDAGTYYITIPHKPSDWAKETVNSVKKFWIRARVTAGAYTTPPKLDRIKITNLDVYRVYYFDTAANSIMDDILAGTGYSMDGTDVCPANTISIVGEYETKLRFIAGVANALTWDDSGDKKAYQWWVDTSKKVHFKQERGTVRGNITQDLVILNNVMDYFNLSNRLHFLGNYDGLNQLRTVIEDTASQDTHGIRELVVPEERYNNYIPLKEAAQKAMTHTKAPLQKIPATLPTTKWLANSLEVGDTVTIHQPRWNVDEQALQIVRADIGPSTTKLDIGISQEHLDGLKAGLQRRLDISGIRMHGSTLILQFGPNEMNYQRVDASTVYPSRLKFEIPSDARYIHKVVISWKMGPFRADVTGGEESEGHDHDAWAGAGGAHEHGGSAGAGGAHNSSVLDGGLHTPIALPAGVHEHTVTILMTYSTEIGYVVSNKHTAYESAHKHPKGRTGGPDDVEDAVIMLYYGSHCVSGDCVDWADSAEFAEGSHWHLNTGLETGQTSHRHDIVTSTTERWFPYDPITASQHTFTEEPDHDTTINQVSAHPHTAVAIAAHANHVISTQIAHGNHSIVTQAAAMIDMVLGIVEIAGGTTMMLIVNGETVASNYDGDQTDVVITGYTNTGSNTVEIQPIVGANTKGSTSIEGRGKLFIETSSF